VARSFHYDTFQLPIVLALEGFNMLKLIGGAINVIEPYAVGGFPCLFIFGVNRRLSDHSASLSHRRSLRAACSLYHKLGRYTSPSY